MFQVTKLSILTALRFNSKKMGEQEKIHIYHTPPTELENSCDLAWNLQWRIEDGLLAAILQIVRLEGPRLACECIITHGHRLPREICLGLPFSGPDPSSTEIVALFKALSSRMPGCYIKVFVS